MVDFDLLRCPQKLELWVVAQKPELRRIINGESTRVGVRRAEELAVGEVYAIGRRGVKRALDVKRRVASEDQPRRIYQVEVCEGLQLPVDIGYVAAGYTRDDVADVAAGILEICGEVLVQSELLKAVK